MKNILTLAVACSIALSAAGQTTDANTGPTNKQLRKARPQYFHAGIGLDRATVRDFATSPLTYKGILANYSLGLAKFDERRESRFTVRFNHGGVHYKNNDGVEVRSRASVYMLDFNYMKLYQLKKFSNSRWNFKLGGMGAVSMDVRYNPDLMNAGLGYEVFNTFSLSGKVSRVFRRSPGEVNKFLFFKLKRPMVSMLSYQLNAPVMNNTVRNGFGYIGNEQIDSAGLFNGYKGKAFSGTRITSELSYARQMQNGNMWKLSYFWDARLVGDKFNRLEMANHILELSILFHLNKNVQQ